MIKHVTIYSSMNYHSIFIYKIMVCWL